VHPRCVGGCGDDQREKKKKGHSSDGKVLRKRGCVKSHGGNVGKWSKGTRSIRGGVREVRTSSADLRFDAGRGRSEKKLKKGRSAVESVPERVHRHVRRQCVKIFQTLRRKHVAVHMAIGWQKAQ